MSEVKHIKPARGQRLAWLEGIRIFAAIVLLIYHAQLLFTDYAFTPQPTGLIDNLRQISTASAKLGTGWLPTIASFPIWFGFQFVDVFVLVSGFSLVLSLKGKPIQVGDFLQRRLVRILLPFWAVAWLSYPILWTIGTLTHSYIPNAWHVFAGMTFPMLFDYGGDLLLPINGPWWFVPLILSFALIFPLMWNLLHRWGTRNFLILTTVITFVYRLLGAYVFQGHPTYSSIGTASGWEPFVPFIAKLSTFALGMVIAQDYLQGKGAIFWQSRKVLIIGSITYIAGFLGQFYRWGWVFNDFLLAIGLSLLCMLVFRSLSQFHILGRQFRLDGVMAWLGLHSYSYFLIHNFVVDRTLNLWVKDQLSSYYVILPVMIVGTLALAIVSDAVTPKLDRSVRRVFGYVDVLLTPIERRRSQTWLPKIGQAVCYQERQGWMIINFEQVIHDRTFYLCQISNGQKKIWVNQIDLVQDFQPQEAGVQ